MIIDVFRILKTGKPYTIYLGAWSKPFDRESWKYHAFTKGRETVKNRTYLRLAISCQRRAMTTYIVSVRWGRIYTKDINRSLVLP